LPHGRRNRESLPTRPRLRFTEGPSRQKRPTENLPMSRPPRHFWMKLSSALLQRSALVVTIADFTATAASGSSPFNVRVSDKRPARQHRQSPTPASTPTSRFTKKLTQYFMETRHRRPAPPLTTPLASPAWFQATSSPQSSSNVAFNNIQQLERHDADFPRVRVSCAAPDKPAPNEHARPRSRNFQSSKRRNRKH